MVTGIDSAPKAIELAESIGSLDRIDYQVEDFLAFNPAYLEGYDWVFEHTCLCALFYQSSVKTMLMHCAAC